MHETGCMVSNPTKSENKKLKFVKLLIARDHKHHLLSVPSTVLWRSGFGRPEHKKEMKNASEDLK